MAYKSKGYRQALEKVNRVYRYPLTEAMDLVATMARTKFDETVDMAVRLGVDPRKADQNIRGAVVLPHGTGKTIRVIVFAKGEKVREAQDAGADYVGGEELVAKISEERWLEFDSAVATPDMMSIVGRLGKILGPRGLMPNPKVGTVTVEVGRAVQELKGGKVEYRVDKGGNIHASIGKASFGPQKLLDNAGVLLGSLIRVKPPAAKGTYLLGVTVTTTMGPGVKIDLASLQGLGV